MGKISGIENLLISCALELLTQVESFIKTEIRLLPVNTITEREY